MKRSHFLTLAGLSATSVGVLAVVAPGTLLGELKHAEINPASLVMARTTGVLLTMIGALGVAVRNHPDTPTLRVVLLMILGVQLGLLPIDPLAWYAGTFHTLGSFVPNTVLHLLLAAGASFYATRPLPR